MIKQIQIGEIIIINGREFLVSETAIGGSDKKRPSLILLKNILKGIYREPYYKRQMKGGLLK